MVANAVTSGALIFMAVAMMLTRTGLLQVRARAAVPRTTTLEALSVA